jgi:hypothetical protein
MAPNSARSPRRIRPVADTGARTRAGRQCAPNDSLEARGCKAMP